MALRCAAQCPGRAAVGRVAESSSAARGDAAEGGLLAEAKHGADARRLDLPEEEEEKERGSDTQAEDQPAHPVVPAAVGAGHVAILILVAANHGVSRCRVKSMGSDDSEESVLAQTTPCRHWQIIYGAVCARYLS